MQSLQSAATDTADTGNIPDVVFRDYDIRGIAGTEITADFANRLGKGLGTLLRRNGEENYLHWPRCPTQFAGTRRSPASRATLLRYQCCESG